MFDGLGYFGSGFCWETHPFGTAHGRKVLNDRELSRGGNGSSALPVLFAYLFPQCMRTKIQKATHHESLDIFLSSPGTIVLRHGEPAMP